LKKNATSDNDDDEMYGDVLWLMHVIG